MLSLCYDFPWLHYEFPDSSKKHSPDFPWPYKPCIKHSSFTWLINVLVFTICIQHSDNLVELEGMHFTWLFLETYIYIYIYYNGKSDDEVDEYNNVYHKTNKMGLLILIISKLHILTLMVKIMINEYWCC